MIPVKQTSSLAPKVQQDHELKLCPLELLGDRRPTLFQSHPKEFSRIPVNHSTPYIYTTIGPSIPVNHCTPYTYIKHSVEFKVTHYTSCTYITDCARCVINPRQSSKSQFHYQTPKNPPKLAKLPRQTPRQCKPTLNFASPHLATTSCLTSTPVSTQDQPHPPKGSKAYSVKPPGHLEFW